jgi:DNA repair protein RadC
MDNYIPSQAIRCWAEDDRPREKLMLKGRHSLSDAELLAILIASGTKHDSALDLAKKVLQKADSNLPELSRLTIHELTSIGGIGNARAVTIMAALELGRRRNESEVLSRGQIKSSKDAFEIFRNTMGDRPYEEFWIVMLNKANRILRKYQISEGGISGTVVDPKKVFKICLENHASSVILGHNHPSGLLRPSDGDLIVTKKLVEAGKLLEISIIDHLIISDNSYYSFADEGRL